MDNTSNRKKRIVRGVDIAVVLLGFVFFAFFTFLCKEKESNYSFDEGSIYEWGDDWTLSAGNTTNMKVTLPIDIDVERGKTVILKKELPTKIKKYNCLMFESERQDVLVNVGGVLRSSYSDKETRKFGKSSPESIMLIPIYTSDESKDVTLLISSDSKYSGKIGNVYLGNEKSIVLMLVKSNIVWLAFCLAIALMGIICLVCYFMYRNSNYEGHAFLYMFWYSFVSVLFILMGIRIRQVFFGNLRLLDTLGYLSFMLLAVAVLGYDNWIMRSKHIKILFVATMAVVINFIVQCMLQILNIYDLNEMVIVTRMLYLTIFGVVYHYVIYDIKHDVGEDKFRSNVYLLIGTSLLFVDLCVGIICGLHRVEHISSNINIAITLIYISTNLLYLFLNLIREEARRRNAENANAAKSQFLATMSHEIRTPINAVLGMNEMISRETNENNIREYSDNIAYAGKSLLSLVNDILDFSKIESGKMDIVCVEYPMKSLLMDLIVMLKGRMDNKGLELILNIDESIPSKYYGDEVRVKQILTNILTNSVKYTPSGRITVTVENRGITDDEILLYFSVKDTGIGIKKEDIDRLMNSAFIRVDAARNRNIEGTGLGLSITRQLLTLMGSNLEIDSVYGEGSDFHFELKQKIVDSTPMGSISVRTERESKKKVIDYTIPDVRILAVDDTKTNLLVIKGLLKPYKCTLVTCESGEKCIEICREQTFDIIFMDHMMPEMDGIETLKSLKEKELLPPNSKVIALTANAISGAAEKYMESGFDGYVTKPIDVKELDECIRNSIDPKMIVKE